MWPYVKEAVLQQLFRKLQLPLDDTNNANDDKLDTQMAAPQQQQKK